MPKQYKIFMIGLVVGLLVGFLASILITDQYEIKDRIKYNKWTGQAWRMTSYSGGFYWMKIHDEKEEK